jgi:hypothetical protein
MMLCEYPQHPSTASMSLKCSHHVGNFSKTWVLAQHWYESCGMVLTLVAQPPWPVACLVVISNHFAWAEICGYPNLATGHGMRLGCAPNLAKREIRLRVMFSWFYINGLRVKQTVGAQNCSDFQVQQGTWKATPKSECGAIWWEVKNPLHAR